MPLMSPPDEPLTRAIVRLQGPPSNEQAGTGNGQDVTKRPDAVLQGHGGSPGIVRGPVKVIGSVYQADKLQRGDILVAETTATPWTPLFATVAAVVTDSGGILSHCAVVAREYHIPAVVGTGNATKTLQDGQMIEVDGHLGTVRVIG